MATHSHIPRGEQQKGDQGNLVFGSFRVDLRDERLWQGHVTIPLKAKAFAVLRCLITNAGRLMTKDGLFAAVWPGTMVSESVLTVAIRQLRHALGDQARTPTFIETVHGRGYRFIAPVAPAEASLETRQRPPASPLPRLDVRVHLPTLRLRRPRCG